MTNKQKEPSFLSWLGLLPVREPGAERILHKTRGQWQDIFFDATRVIRAQIFAFALFDRARGGDAECCLVRLIEAGRKFNGDDDSGSVRRGV